MLPKNNDRYSGLSSLTAVSFTQPLFAVINNPTSISDPTHLSSHCSLQRKEKPAPRGWGEQSLHPALTYLPQCQTQSSQACGHWASEPCGCDSSAGKCSVLSRGSGHTRLEHDTSHWNRGRNQHFQAQCRCSNNTEHTQHCSHRDQGFLPCPAAHSLSKWDF